MVLIVILRNLKDANIRCLCSRFSIEHQKLKHNFPSKLLQSINNSFVRFARCKEDLGSLDKECRIQDEHVTQYTYREHPIDWQCYSKHIVSTFSETLFFISRWIIFLLLLFVKNWNYRYFSNLFSFHFRDGCGLTCDSTRKNSRKDKGISTILFLRYIVYEMVYFRLFFFCVCFFSYWLEIPV